MIKRYSLFTVPRWLFWAFIIFIVFFFSTLAYGSHLYKEIEESKEEGFETSKELVLDKTEMKKIDNITRYHGKSYYHVIIGTTKVGESAIAYVPINKEDESIAFFLTEEILSEEEALGIWKSNCQACSLTETNMAIEDGHPLLEIIYISNNDRLVYCYISLEDGTTFRTVPLKRSIY